jgi:hypothetical protein
VQLLCTLRVRTARAPRRIDSLIVILPTLDSGKTLGRYVSGRYQGGGNSRTVVSMRAPRPAWTPQAPPPRSVPESPDHQEERAARIDAMMTQARKHVTKPDLPRPAPTRQAIVDLETVIARAIPFPHNR